MQPFVHYIPVENDFSDFNNKFNWALENEEEVEEIGKNGRDFAIKNLRRRNAVYRYKNILLRLGKAN